MSEPVARVFVHKTGGNVGIRWSGVPVDGAPLMHDGELLYTADAIREAVLAEREAISKFCADVHEKSASCDDGLDPFENGIKWTTEQISSWIEKRGAV